jgi:two-component system response regulator MprA
VPAILIVDDEPAIRDALAQLFDDEGYSATVARDGAEALAAHDRVKPQLILSDIHMPVMDGVTMVQTLRDRGDLTPVLLISSLQPICSLPRVRCLQKPFNVDELLEIVSELIEQRGITLA